MPEHHNIGPSPKYWKRRCVFFCFMGSSFRSFILFFPTPFHAFISRYKEIVYFHKANKWEVTIYLFRSSFIYLSLRRSPSIPNMFFLWNTPSKLSGGSVCCNLGVRSRQPARTAAYYKHGPREDGSAPRHRKAKNVSHVTTMLSMWQHHTYIYIYIYYIHIFVYEYMNIFICMYIYIIIFKQTLANSSRTVRRQTD